MPDRTGQQMVFGRVGRRGIDADFKGGAIGSDGGVMLVRQLDRKIGLSATVAAALSDPRDPERIPIPCAISSPSVCTDGAAAMRI